MAKLRLCMLFKITLLTCTTSSREQPTTDSRRWKASTLEMSLRIAASTSCKTTRRLPLQAPNRPRPRSRVAREHESISPIYSAASGNFPADGRHLPGRSCRLYAAPGFRVAGSRLSHDSGGHILSRSQSERRCYDGNGPAGTPIWSNARIEPDDFHQFRWHLRGGLAVQS